MHVFQLLVRGPQIAFAAIVLGLTVVLAKGQINGSVPALWGYAAFCGAFGLLVALIGVAAAIVESFPGLIMAAVDGLCTLFYVAAGIALAVKLGVHSCSPDASALRDACDAANKNCGKVPDNANIYTYFNDLINADSTIADYPGRCREAQASTAFIWFAFACFAISAVLDLMGGRSSSSGGGGGGFRFGRKRGASSYV